MDWEAIGPHVGRRKSYAFVLVDIVFATQVHETSTHSLHSTPSHMFTLPAFLWRYIPQLRAVHPQSILPIDLSQALTESRCVGGRSNSPRVSLHSCSARFRTLRNSAQVCSIVFAAFRLGVDDCESFAMISDRKCGQQAYSSSVESWMTTTGSRMQTISGYT